MRYYQTFDNHINNLQRIFGTTDAYQNYQSAKNEIYRHYLEDEARKAEEKRLKKLEIKIEAEALKEVKKQIDNLFK